MGSFFLVCSGSYACLWVHACAGVGACNTKTPEAELVPPDGGLEFHVGNVCELRQFPDGAFDLVVDKAMLDALLIAPPGADADWVEARDLLCSPTSWVT